jgi:hypothetical protein
MDREEILKLEYEQQFGQYRWIGSQQTLIFTFYAAITAASFALMGAFLKDCTTSSLYPWFFIVLLFLGVVGIFISLALINSRSTQLRIQFYLVELLIQLTENSETTKVSLPAIRFRGVTSTAGKFSARDTPVIAISLSFVFGIAQIWAAIALMAINYYPQININIFAWVLLIIVSILSLIGICCILPKRLDKEIEKAKKEHKCSKNVTNWAEHLRDLIGLK